MLDDFLLSGTMALCPKVASYDGRNRSVQADLPKDRAARRVEIRKKPSPDTVAQMPFPLKDWKNEQKRLEKCKGKNPHKYIRSVDDIKSASLT